MLALLVTIQVALWSGAAPNAAAQAVFAGVSSVLGTGTAFSSPAEVAVDSSGDVFVLDGETGLVSEIVAVNGVIPASPTIQVLANSFAFNGAVGMAIDTNGNLFLPGAIDGSTYAMYEIPASSRSVNPTQLGGSFNTPGSVAVDASGNVYVAEDGEPYDVKEISVTSGYTTVTTPISGLAAPSGVAIDASGNIFVADGSGSSIKEYTSASSYASHTTFPMSFGAILNMAIDANGNLYAVDGDNLALYEILSAGGYSTEVTLAGNFSFPYGVASAPNGNLFVADDGTTGVIDEFERPTVNFGTVNFAASATVHSLKFIFTGTATISSISVLTQGVSGMDFSDAGTGSCTTNGPSHSYSAGDTCTLDIMFSPTAPRTRAGTIVLSGGGGMIATAYLIGTGVGPQAEFPNTNLVEIDPPDYGNLNEPLSIAVDGAGNVYVADYNLTSLVVFPPNCFGTGCTTSTVGGGLNEPKAVAIDGAGNLYVADFGDNTIKMMPSNCADSTCVTTLGGGFNQPQGVAVDNSGNVYVSDAGNYRVVEMPPGCAGAACVTPIGGGFATPEGLVADGSGNVFVADPYPNTTARYLSKIPSGCLSSSCTVGLGGGFSHPRGVAVDGSGNIYIADTTNSQLKEMPGTCASSACVTTLASSGYSGVNEPYGVFVTSGNNLYVTDTDNHKIKEIDQSDGPALSFASTAVGSTSAQQVVAFSNAGNASMTIFSLAGTNANFAGAGTTCSTGTPLAAGASCNLGVKFAPTAPGSPLTGSANITDNGLPGAQSIPVSGTATGQPPTVTGVSPATGAAAGGTSVTITGTNLYSGATVSFGSTAATNVTVVSQTSITATSPAGAGAVDVTVTTGAGTSATSSADIFTYIAADTTATAVTVSPTTVVLGQTVTVTATVTDATNSGTTPTGSVTFTDTVGSTITNLNSGNPVSLTSGVATLSNVTLNGAGTHTIAAVYAGVSGSLASSGGSAAATVIPASNIGTAGAAFPVTLTFSAAGTVGTVSVLTQGAANLDFTDAVTGDTCTGAYTVAATCTVNVVFTPRYPGQRSGAVQLADGDGNILATAYIQGVGTGPQVVFSKNNVQTSLGGGFLYPVSIALDGSANVFLAEPTNADVKRILASGGYGVVQTLGGGYSFGQPAGVAVDGAGNVIVADYGNSQVDQILAKGGYTTVNVLANYPTVNAPNGVAVDGNGNIFVTDQLNNAVYEMLAASGYATVNTLAGGFNGPNGVAVDVSGNVYVADTGHNAVKEVVAVSGVIPNSPTILTLGGGFSSPNAVAVDASGAIFVADTGHGAVKTMPAGCASAACVSSLGSGFTSPFGVALSGNGNLFLVDYLSGLTQELNFSSPPSLLFPTTVVGSTSSAQAVSISNDGNSVLTLAAAGLASPTDYRQVAGSGTPVDCSNSATVASGASCNLSVAFQPLSTGAHAESFVLTDDSRNVTGATQSISLSGTGIVTDATATAVTVTPSTVNLNAVTTLQATVTDTVHSGTTPTGTVTFTDTLFSSTTTAASNVALVSGVATHPYTVSGIGSHTITATYTPSSGFVASSGTASMTVGKDTPLILWATPAPIVEGTALSGTQLDATSKIAGAFVYDPAAGTVPAAGVVPLHVTLNPTNTADFNSATATVNLLVLPAPQNFGSEAVGATGSPISITFPFGSAVTLGSPGIQVLTDGATGLDFANAGTGSCAAGGTIGAGSSCTVAITFSPKYPGLRRGAVVLLDGSGNVLATVYLYGTGTGPMINFLPGVGALVADSEAPYNLQSPVSSQVDLSGNVYVTDRVGNAVYKETPSGNQYVQTALPATGLNGPEDAAVDGAGNVYIADTVNLRVVELANAGGTYTQSTILNLTTPGGIAVDAQGNLYVSDVNDGLVYKETLANGAYTQTTVASGLNQPRKVAVDASGNVYVADSNNGQVLKETPNGSGYTPTVVLGSLNEPYGVAVDTNGNVYIADRGDGSIYIETPSGAGYTNFQTYPGGVGVASESSIAVDQRGNLYTSSSSLNVVSKADRFDPPSFDYPNTAVGQTDSIGAAPLIFLNQGNATLTLAVPSTGLNPTLTAGFALSGSTTCARVAAGGSAIDFAPNANCFYGINFIPVAGGLDSGALAFTDNSLNQAGATQSVGLAGTGIAPDVTATALSISPSSISYGSTTTLTATVTDTTSTGTTPTGTVNFTDTFNGVTTSIASAVNFFGNEATTNYFGTTVGSHTITATYVPAGNFVASSTTAALVVAKATPTITWAAPAPIYYGTSLAGVLTALANGVQQNVAPASVGGKANEIRPNGRIDGLSGTYAYTATPTGGSSSTVTAATILAVGIYQLGVIFTPTDAADYTTATATVTLLVLPPPTSFGNLAAGTTSAPITVSIPFAAAVTLGDPGVQVVTKGTSGLDFANAGTGTCTAHKVISAGVTCTVAVTFTPKYPGARYGAIVLYNAAGDVVATEFLSGVGTAGMVNFPPGTQSEIAGASAPYNLTGPQAVAVDSNGNVYVAEPTRLLKETLSAGSYTQTTVATGFTYLTDVTADGAGNLYVTDYSANTVYRETLAGSAYAQSVVADSSAGFGLSEPFGVVVDGSGNVYLADYNNNRVVKETPGGSAYVQSVVVSGLNQPSGLALDASGALYVADTLNNRVLKETPSGAGYTQAVVADSSAGYGLNNPYKLAVDADGNVFIADFQNDRIVKETLSGGSYVQSVAVASSGRPLSVAHDQQGDLFFVNNNDTNVYKVDLFDSPSLSFASTYAGFTSPDSPLTVPVQNAGNAALNFPAPSSGLDPAATVGFAVDAATTCPKIAPGGAAGTLAANATCSYAVDFSPAAAGAIAGTLTLTDNALNLAGAKQAIPLSGTAMPGPAKLAVTGGIPSPVLSGGNLGQVTVDVEDPSGIIVPVATNTVTVTVTGPSGFSQTTSGAAISGVYTADLSAFALVSGGTYTVTATSPGLASAAATSQVVVPPPPVVFANTPAGTSSGALSVPFQFTASATLGNPGVLVLTEGVPGLDFANAGTGTCVAGLAVASSSSCTVAVTFSPKYPGVRYGAVLLLDASGNILSTQYISGVGTGATAIFPPGVQSTVATSETQPFGMAVDSKGNLYLSSPTVGRVWKETLVSGAYTESDLATGLSQPNGVAVDGAGNVYVAEFGTGRILKFVLSNGAYTQAVAVTGLAGPYGVAVDGAGNLYVADGSANSVYRETLIDGAYVQTTIRTGLSLPSGVAVDGMGNVYISDTNNYEVLKETLSNGSYSETVALSSSDVESPYGLAVDAAGNIYVADYNYSAIFKGTLAGGVYTESTVSLNVAYPECVAVDAAGNLYVADNNDLTIKLDLADPPSLSFATTDAGSTSSDSPQFVTLGNIGNEPLAVAVPTSGTNPGIGSGFTISQSKGTTCPQVSAGGSADTVPVNAECTYAIDFTPTKAGVNTGSLALNDNNYNLTGTIQNVPLTGTGVALAASKLAFSGVPTSIFAGGNLGTVQVQVTDLYGNLITASTASVTLTVTGPGGYSQIVTGMAVNGVFTANLSGSALSSPGSYSLAASSASLTSATAAVTVNLVPTAVAASPASSPYSPTSQGLTLAATVTSSAGVVNNGNITFTVLNGATQVGSAVTSGTVTNGAASAVYMLPPGTAAGVYSIQAVFNASGIFAASTDASHTLTLTKAAATVALNGLAQTYTGAPLAVSATTTPTSLTVKVTYNGSPEAPSAAGSYTVIATIDDPNYSGTATGTLVIAQASQSIAFAPLPSPITYTAPIPLVATGGASGNPVVFSVLSGPGTIGGDLLMLTSSGTLVVAANQAGNANYAAATQATQTVISLASTLKSNASALIFGSVPVGMASPTQTLIVSNPNVFAVTGVSATATGDFTAASNCPTIAGLGTCSINITFTPTASGSRTGTLTVGDAQSSGQLTAALSGTGTAAGIQFNAAALHFGSEVTGATSVGQTVTIQNTGTANLVVSNIATTGDFATTGNCATVPAGSNCSLTVTFTPTATGSRTGELTLTDNVGGADQSQTLTLSGLGTAAGAALTPSVAIFPGTGVGSSSFVFNTTLTNTGTIPLTGISISILGDFTQANTCTASLAAGVSCIIGITYSPTIPGAETGTLIVADNLGTQTVALNGTGVAPGASLSTGQLLFGGQLVGTSSLAQTVVFSNTGLTTVGIISVTPSSGFTDTTNCSGSIASQASCSVNVFFTPTGAGAANGTLTLVDDAGTQVVTLSGQGVSPGLTIAPSFVIFGSQTVGTSSQAQTLTVTNTSSSALTLNSITVPNGFAVTAQCPAVIEPGSTYAISVSFAPTSIGSISGSLVIGDTTGSFSTLATLSGQGTLAGIAASPASLSFGSVPLGIASQGQTVTVSNTGILPLKIGTVTGAGDFAETDTCSNRTVAPGGNCVISVTMTPTTAGTRTGAIQFANSADGLQTIALSGVGQNAGVSITPASLAFGSAPIASSTQAATGTSLNVAIGNTSAGVLTLSGFATQGDFSESSNCGTTLAAGNSCNLTVTFLPTALGHRTGTLTITDDAGGNSQTVSLAGDGSPAGLILTPPVLDFGVQTQGATSAPLIATLSNNTGKSITDLSIVASGEYAETDDCGTALANAASCTLRITVTPATSGAITGTVAISGGGVIAAIPHGRSDATCSNGASSTSGIGVVATLADTNGASTVSQLAFGITPPPTVTAGGNAGASVSVRENSSSGSIVAGSDTITLTVTGPGGYDKTYTAKASGGVATFNLSGDALTTAGNYTYTVSVASKASIKTISVAETVNPGAAAVVSSTAGSGQSAIVDQPFATALQVTVKDAYGNAESGSTVTFAAPATGASAKLSNLTAVTGVAGTASVTATANGIPGVYEITASVAGATAATFSLTNSGATPTVTLVSSNNRILFNSQVAFTATVSASAGTPTGTVKFNDGTTLLGSGTIASGTVTFTTSSLAAGVHSITVVYSGDSIFSSATSAALTQTVVDYAVSPSGASTQTVTPGGAATYVVAVTPTEGTDLPAVATLTVTGLPAGATASLTTASTTATWTQLTATSWQVPASTTLGDVSLTFSIPALATAAPKPEQPGRSASPLLWALLLLPFAARFGRAGKRMRRALLLLFCLAASGVAIAGFSGCSARNGFFGQPPTAYDITVTVTAGSLSHSTNLTLKVE